MSDSEGESSSNWCEIEQKQETDKRQQREAKEREISARLGKMQTENRNASELVEKLASVEFQLKEATAEVETTKEQATQAEKEKGLFKNKAYDLAARLSALKKRLQEKEAETAELQTTNRELEEKIASLREEVKSTETHLNKSYNDTLEGLTNHIQEAQKQIEDLDNENNELRFSVAEAQRVCTYLQKKLEESERTHSATDADTKFRLTEAQRVSRFLEGKLTKMVEEKQQVENRIAGLQEEVEKLKSVISRKDTVIAEHAEKMKQKEAVVADASRQVLEVEGKLAASVKICAFLESTLGKAEAALARRGPHPDAVKEINELKKKLAESNEMISSLNDGLAVAHVSQKTMVNQVGKLQDEITVLSSELAEKEDQARNYKTRWQIEAERTTDLTASITKLKNMLEETKKQMKAIEIEKQALSQQLDDRVDGMESSLNVYTGQVQELSSRILQMETEKKQWQVKADSLQGDIKSYSAQVGELQTKVAQAEAEKEKWYKKAQSMEHALSGMADVEELKAQVSQAQRERQEWENKAELLEVQLSTICDILKESKPELVERFSGDTDKDNGTANRAGGGRGYVAGAAQSVLGNKAVLALTLAAAIVTIVAGDYSSGSFAQRPPLAFVSSESDLVSGDLQEVEITSGTPMVCPVEFDFESAEQLKEATQESFDEADRFEATMMLPQEEPWGRVQRVVRTLKETRHGIWGKLMSMEKPKISEEAIMNMVSKISEDAILSLV